METSAREQWKRVPRYPTYWVSDRGRMRHRNKHVSFYNVVHGYKTVTLATGKGKQTTEYVHRLMLEAFVGPCPKGKKAYFIDRNKGNVTLTNLAWGNPNAGNPRIPEIVGADLQRYQDMYADKIPITTMARIMKVNYAALYVRLVSLGIHKPKPKRRPGSM